jgi:hypothetical protein
MFDRDQRNQSHLSYISLMADWIAAYGKMLMPHKRARQAVATKTNAIK